MQIRAAQIATVIFGFILSFLMIFFVGIIFLFKRSRINCGSFLCNLITNILFSVGSVAGAGVTLTDVKNLEKFYKTLKNTKCSTVFVEKIFEHFVD